MEVKPSIFLGGGFLKLVEESTIFIDKSLFIKEVYEDKSEVILITMPRRFGKSTNLEMLRMFLSIEEDNVEAKIINRRILTKKIKNVDKLENAHLDISSVVTLIRDSKQFGKFKKIEILSLQGQYPVIFMDLKKTTIGKEYISLLHRIKLFYPTAIKKLSDLLKEYHSKRVWLLIDEYDAAANKAHLKFSSDEAQSVADLFRSILEPALKNNQNLEKGVTTGVQYILKSGILLGLNNLIKHNITSCKYSKYYGLSEVELRILLNHFKLEKDKSYIKSWYNGYLFNIGTNVNPCFIDKYNVWSVVNYISNPDKFVSYWDNNNLSEFLNSNILNNHAIKDIIEDLVRNRNLLISNLTTDFSVNNFLILKSITSNLNKIEVTNEGINLLFSYLFITGYLTITRSVNEYCIPNNEIKNEFQKVLLLYYENIFNVPPSFFDDMTKILFDVFEADESSISSIFTKSFGPKLSLLVGHLKLYSKFDKDVSVGLYGK
ncbi:uncharacterized protein LOC136075148 [Hydra vulgaris]|uniref:Uncharacterized protein LOC136075148 n=1 Tax=Hydra vulgaris TaxID=6087 RepID=A0ABM4B422_HYDVU